MSPCRRWLAYFAVLTMLPTVLLGQLVSPAADRPRDGVFVHISHGSDDVHRLLMGMQMAVTMAEAKKDVIIYCDIEAVKVLKADAPDISMKPFRSLHELLERLAKLHVRVMACPTCMKVAGMEANDLRAGVEVANKDRFFDFTAGRMLTIDY
ncbi:MAG: DsrE family protein [Bacteroidetes bacterium]|nr:DsrE family protein [Bacteroidota bacterium]